MSTPVTPPKDRETSALNTPGPRAVHCPPSIVYAVPSRWQSVSALQKRVARSAKMKVSKRQGTSTVSEALWCG